MANVPSHLLYTEEHEYVHKSDVDNVVEIAVDDTVAMKVNVTPVTGLDAAIAVFGIQLADFREDFRSDDSTKFRVTRDEQQGMGDVLNGRLPIHILSVHPVSHRIYDRLIQLFFGFAYRAKQFFGPVRMLLAILDQ